MLKLTAIVLLIAAYNLYFFPVLIPVPGHIDFLLFTSVVLTALWLMFWPSRWLTQTRYAVSTTVIAMGGAMLALFEANPVSAVLIGFITLCLTLVTLYLLLIKDEQFGGIFEMLFMPFRVMEAWIYRFFHQSGEWGKLKSKVTPGGTVKGVARGAIISLPLIFVILGLLSSADPIFGKLVGNILKLPQDLVQRVFFSTALLIGLVPLALSAIRTRFISPATSSGWSRYPVEIMTVVSIVAVVLGAFLAVQFRYLFATVPETELTQFGIDTYSEYVRRGFMEMIFVTCIAYGIAAVGYLVTRSTNALALKRMNLILLAEVGLFIASIFRRVYLYQLHHGLTRIRVFGSVFVIYLFGLVLFLALRYLMGLKKPWYLYEFGLGVVLVVLTALIKPDALIASRFPPTVNREIDYVYLSRLSIDALPGWVAAFDHAKSILAEAPDPVSTPSSEAVRQIIYAHDATTELLGTYYFLMARYGTKAEFVRFNDTTEAEPSYVIRRKRGQLDRNLAEARAYLQLTQSIDPLELKKLQTGLWTYMQNLPPSVRNLPLDRSYDSPLTRR